MNVPLRSLDLRTVGLSGALAGVQRRSDGIPGNSDQGAAVLSGAEAESALSIDTGVRQDPDQCHLS